jgi:Na+-translocating ferredoxin:NAD+ oxidoreductase RnfG subunit
MMKKETKKSNEAQLLDLLKRVLPKATHDAQLAEKIFPTQAAVMTVDAFIAEQGE